MFIYLCSRYSRFPEMQAYAKDLEALGHTITSRWIRGDHELRAHGDAEHASWQQHDDDELCYAPLSDLPVPDLPQVPETAPEARVLWPWYVRHPEEQQPEPARPRHVQ